MSCSLCQRQLESGTPTYRRVQGWERRSQGPSRRGGSDIVLREPTGEVACWACVERVRLGLAPTQETLGA